MSAIDSSLQNNKYNLKFCLLKDSGFSQNTDMILQETGNRYRSFFENMEQGYYEIDLYGNFIFFNGLVCKIFGYSKDELYKVNYIRFMNKENKGIAYNAFNDVFKTEKPRIGCVFQVVRKDGLTRQVSLSICPVKNSSGNKTGFRGTVSDISGQKILEAQKRHAQKLESIGQLAAGIAHEINTPLQYTTDNTRFLLDSFAEIEIILTSYHKLLESVKLGRETQAVIRELDTLISQIDLDYLIKEIPKAIGQSLEGLDNVSKIVVALKQFSHPGTDEKICIDINKAIENTIVISRNEWKYIADVITDYDLSMPMIPCLPGEFNQVILNLIINASHAVADSIDKASGNKGIIKIKTRCNDSWAEIRISDTGPGIPEEIRERIFDPFFTTKEVGKGSGQGLAISHSVIVKKHGGSIGFETKINQGTTMIIRIPTGKGNG
ncbi:PAS domain-containing sensor histidine kinase [Desulfobacterium sp. N47]